jgi:hypothetical protein
LCGQFLNDRLELLGVEHAGRFREAAQGESLDAQGPGHVLQIRRFLQSPHRVDQRIPDIEQHELAVIGEKQLAIAGRVALAAHIMQMVEQIEDAPQMAETNDVFFLKRLTLDHERLECHRKAGSAISKSC